MPNSVIDLRRLKDELKGPVSESSSPPGNPQPAANDPIPAEPSHDSSVTPPLFAWTAAEAETNAASTTLSFLVGGALLLGGVAAAIFASFLFALLLFIAGGLMIAHAYRAPRQIHVAITGRGIRIENRLYLFDNLESFWILYDPPLFRDLVLRSQKTFTPIIRVPLGDLDPLPLRKILLRFLREAEEEPSLTDIIAKHLGF
jgi:hypothetical protein